MRGAWVSPWKQLTHLALRLHAVRHGRAPDVEVSAATAGPVRSALTAVISRNPALGQSCTTRLYGSAVTLAACPPGGQGTCRPGHGGQGDATGREHLQCEVKGSLLKPLPVRRGNASTVFALRTHPWRRAPPTRKQDHA